jgi:hypothetical protein
MMRVKTVRAMTKDGSSTLVDGQGSQAVNDFEAQIERDLRERQQEVLSFARVPLGVQDESELSYNKAREIVRQLRPAPQFIWRICNYALGNPERINQLTEGSLFGLKRLVLNIASDNTLGCAKESTTAREVTQRVSSDVIAAVVVMHAVARRLQAHDFQPVWKPILEDALLRAQIGYFVGAVYESFGPGRGMLAGFSGRAGLAVLVATGTAEQVTAATRAMAMGEQIDKFSREIFGTEPLHVAGMILSAVGCGRDAVLGIGAYGMSRTQHMLLPNDARKWLATFQLVEALRVGHFAEISEESWLRLDFGSESDRIQMKDIVDSLMRTGHTWGWML